MTVGDLMIEPTIKLGDEVVKRTGYEFPGTVVSVFWTTAGELRYVVEMKHYKLLHIFSPHQLRKADLNEVP